MPPLPGPVFVARRPDRDPPETLPTAELERSIESLRRKLRSAENALLVTRFGGALLALALIGTGFVLLWLGPRPFLERLVGSRAITTTYDVFLWWSVVIVVCVVGGAFGDQLLRGRLRLARGWRHRVEELRHRLEHAEAERRRRRGDERSLRGK
jgi:membrane protein implicated in regulation of membrane protease activity